MSQRGVSLEEVQETLESGTEASDAKPGTAGRTFVLSYGAEGEGRFFESKEVTVYYKSVGEALIVLTVKARYGRDFSHGEQT